MTITSGKVPILAFLMVNIFGCSGLHAQNESRKRKTPFSYEFDFGGMTPTGRHDGLKPSVMVGGGLSLPIGKWVSLDLASLDFGFGTTDQAQTILVSDNTTRTTKNYQMMFGSGPRVNLPLGHKIALGFGGGYGAVFQNEYVPDRVINNGFTTIIQSVNCSSCSRDAYQGPFLEARLFGRSDKYTSLGVSAKYYMVKGSNHSPGSYEYLPPQRWLSVGVTFTFGI